MSGEVRMVEIGHKPVVTRIARASGKIRVKKETINAIAEGRVKKGDVFAVAKLAAIQAVKKTWEIVPLCHPIPISGVSVDLRLLENHVEVSVEVRAQAKTGVEMEALTGVTAALLAVWDMVKELEKDEKGQYPHTAIEEIRVVEKIKRHI